MIHMLLQVSSKTLTTFGKDINKDTQETIKELRARLKDTQLLLLNTVRKGGQYNDNFYCAAAMHFSVIRVFMSRLSKKNPHDLLGPYPNSPSLIPHLSFGRCY